MSAFDPKRTKPVPPDTLPRTEARGRRREFVTLLGGAAVIWPLAARAQKTARIPRIGVLWHAGSVEEEGQFIGAIIAYGPKNKTKKARMARKAARRKKLAAMKRN
jgi:hypothetical protein